MNIHTGKKARFTLIELLVVIAIISILAAMLLPALKRARQKGQEIVCKSNLKQLGLLTANYLSDFDGYFMPLREDGEIYWAMKFYEVFGKSANADYTRESSIMFCPGGKFHGSTKYLSYGSCYYGPMSWIENPVEAATWGSAGSYGPGKAPAKITNIKKRVSRTMLFGEQTTTANIDLGLNIGYYLIKNVSSYTSRFPSDRHGNRSNIVFVDGHAEDRDSTAMNVWLTRGYTVADIPEHFTSYQRGVIEP